MDYLTFVVNRTIFVTDRQSTFERLSRVCEIMSCRSSWWGSRLSNSLTRRTHTANLAIILQHGLKYFESIECLACDSSVPSRPSDCRYQGDSKSTKESAVPLVEMVTFPAISNDSTVSLPIPSLLASC